MRWAQGPARCRDAARGRTRLAHHAEAAAVVERDGGVEAPTAVELHVRPEPVDAGGHRGGETVDAGHRVHPADEQRQPFSRHGVGPHEVRGSVEAEQLRSLTDAVARQVVSLTRRQVGCAVVHPAGDAVGQQVGQGAVDRGVRLAQDARQFRGIDERRPAEGIEHLQVGERHVLRLPAWCHPPDRPGRSSVLGISRGQESCRSRRPPVHVCGLSRSPSTPLDTCRVYTRTVVDQYDLTASSVPDIPYLSTTPTGRPSSLSLCPGSPRRSCGIQNRSRSGG